MIRKNTCLPHHTARQGVASRVLARGGGEASQPSEWVEVQRSCYKVDMDEGVATGRTTWWRSPSTEIQYLSEKNYKIISTHLPINKKSVGKYFS